MEHYNHLIIKALVYGGGSSSESYVYRMLTGDFPEDCTPVSEMWGYLDAPLQEVLIEIFSDVCRVDLSGLNDSQIVRSITEHMAKRAGTKEFFDNTPQHEINRMSDDDYDRALNELINHKHRILLDKE